METDNKIRHKKKYKFYYILGWNENTNNVKYKAYNNSKPHFLLFFGHSSLPNLTQNNTVFFNF